MNHYRMIDMESCCGVGVKRWPSKQVYGLAQGGGHVLGLSVFGHC